MYTFLTFSLIESKRVNFENQIEVLPSAVKRFSLSLEAAEVSFGTMVQWPGRTIENVKSMY